MKVSNSYRNRISGHYGGAFSEITTTANDGAYRDSTQLKGGHTLVYRVQSADGSIVSNESTITF